MTQDGSPDDAKRILAGSERDPRRSLGSAARLTLRVSKQKSPGRLAAQSAAGGAAGPGAKETNSNRDIPRAIAVPVLDAFGTTVSKPLVCLSLCPAPRLNLHQPQAARAQTLVRK